MYNILVNIAPRHSGLYTWAPMRPTGGEPYTFKTFEAAREVLEMCADAGQVYGQDYLIERRSEW